MTARPHLHAMIDAMTPDQRRVATQVLDAVSRPMQPREIELLLRAKGIQRARATILASTLKHFHIIALIGPEDTPGDQHESARTVVEVKRRTLPGKETTE